MSSVLRPSSSSTWPARSTTSTSNGFRRSATSTPMVLDRVLDNERAARFIRYPSSSAACWTRRRLSSRTIGSPRITSETSDFDTPARSATSRIVGRRPFVSPCADIDGPPGRRCSFLDRSNMTRPTRHVKMLFQRQLDRRVERGMARRSAHDASASPTRLNSGFCEEEDRHCRRDSRVATARHVRATRRRQGEALRHESFNCRTGPKH